MPQGSRILIVGASRGIGLALATEALKRFPSATVFATARDPAGASKLQQLRRDSGARLVIVPLDTTQDNTVRSAVELLKHQSHGLDQLWINAGIFGGIGRITQLSKGDFLETLNVNVVGPHICLQAFGPLLLASGADRRGAFIITSSNGSLGVVAWATQRVKERFQTDYMPAGAYSVSKTALNMLARQWADELEPHGVVVALLHPGGVATDGMRQIYERVDGDAEKGMADAITAEASAKGLFDVAETATPAKTTKGVLTWNGAVLPW